MKIGLEFEDFKFHTQSLKERPHHAAVLGRIFTSWALIEANVGGLLSVIMHAEPKAGLAILSTYKSNFERVQAARKIAKAVLEESEFSDFDKVMKRVLKYAERRNKIAHGLWGFRDGDDEHVYWLPNKAVSHTPLHIFDQLMSAAGKGKTCNASLLVAKMSEGMEKFDVCKLEEIEESGIQILEELVRTLHPHLARRLASKNLGFYSTAKPSAVE